MRADAPPSPVLLHTTDVRGYALRYQQMGVVGHEGEGVALDFGPLQGGLKPVEEQFAVLAALKIDPRSPCHALHDIHTGNLSSVFIGDNVLKYHCPQLRRHMEMHPPCSRQRLLNGLGHVRVMPEPAILRADGHLVQVDRFIEPLELR